MTPCPYPREFSVEFDGENVFMGRNSRRKLHSPRPQTRRTEHVASCAAYDADQVLSPMVEANCDARTPSSCPERTHIDFAREPCAVCVEDTKENRTCDWAESCFEPFVLTIAKTSGALLCEADDDCFAHRIDAKCVESVKVALNGYIDEEITWIAQLFATQNCASCDVSDEVTFSTAPATGNDLGLRTFQKVCD